MRILGLLFVAFGLLLCLTLIFAWHGLACVGVGALLYLAGKPNPQARFQLGPGVGRRLLIAAAVAIPLLALVALARH